MLLCIALSRRQELAFEPPVGLGEVESGVLQLRAWMKACGDQNIMVISGAGLSTGACVCAYVVCVHERERERERKEEERERVNLNPHLSLNANVSIYALKF